MQSALLDAGPLIALFDHSDKFHKKVLTFFQSFSGNLFTTWPVITETMHFLNFNPNVQSDFLLWLQREPIQIPEQNKVNLEKLRKLILKYSNVPMDLADASLVMLSEERNLHSIITLDADYIVYRIHKKPFRYLL